MQLLTLLRAAMSDDTPGKAVLKINKIKNQHNFSRKTRIIHTHIKMLSNVFKAPFSQILKSTEKFFMEAGKIAGIPESDLRFYFEPEISCKINIPLKRENGEFINVDCYRT